MTFKEFIIAEDGDLNGFYPSTDTQPDNRPQSLSEKDPKGSRKGEKNLKKMFIGRRNLKTIINPA